MLHCPTAASVLWQSGSFVCVDKAGAPLSEHRWGADAFDESAAIFACAPLPPPLPPIGRAVLEREGRVAARGGEQPRSRRMRAFMDKVAAGEPVEILALGASVTAWFGSTEPHGGRLSTEMREERSYVLSLMQTILHAYPEAKVSARSVGIGGATPAFFSACPSRSICHVASTSDGESTRERCPDLLILDLAANHDDEKRCLAHLEQILRYVHQTDIAVVALNIPVFHDYWRRPSSMKVPSGYYTPDAPLTWAAHLQRLLFNRTQTRLLVAQFPTRSQWHERIRHVVHHYGHESVSLFSALQPALTQGRIDLFDLTQDAVHPSLVRTFETIEGGVVRERRIRTPAGLYVSCISDAIAHALSQWLLADDGDANVAATQHQDEGAFKASTGVRRIRPRHGYNRTFAPLPEPIHSNLFASGVECWDSKESLTSALELAGGSRDAILRRWVPGQHNGWLWQEQELGYSGSAVIVDGNRSAGWALVPLHGRPARPGLNSVDPGDVLTFSFDTRLAPWGRPNAQASLRLTFLSSYNQVGVARIACPDAGCSCDTLIWDALRPKAIFAVQETVQLNIGQAEHCKVSITNVSPKERTALGVCHPVSSASLPGEDVAARLAFQPLDGTTRKIWRRNGSAERGPCTKLKLYRIDLLASE